MCWACSGLYVTCENMNRVGRRFGDLGSFGALKFLWFLVSFFLCAGEFNCGCLSKSMGVASLNTNQCFLCFYLCPIFSLSFSFSFSFFCYNVIHLRWMTVVVHLRSPPGKSHLIRFLPRCHLFPLLTFHRGQSPLPAAARRSARLTFQSPNPRSSAVWDPTIPCPWHSSHSPPFADTPPRPYRPIAAVAPIAPVAPWARRTTTEVTAGREKHGRHRKCRRKNGDLLWVYRGIVECPWQACDSQQNRWYFFFRKKQRPTPFALATQYFSSQNSFIL